MTGQPGSPFVPTSSDSRETRKAGNPGRGGAAAEPRTPAHAETGGDNAEENEGRSRPAGKREHLEAQSEKAEKQIRELQARVARLSAEEAEVSRALARLRAQANEGEKARDRAEQADRKLTELLARFGQADRQLEEVKQDWQRVGRLLVAESTSRGDDLRRQYEQARADLEAARRDIAELSARAREARATRDGGTAARWEPTTPADDFPLPPVNELGDEAEETVIRATVRAEMPAQRLARHLNEAWVVENTLVDTLHEIAEEVIDPSLRAVLAEHRQVTQRQKEALETRLRELGKEPAGKKGVLQRAMAGLREMWQREPDDYDRTLHSLQKAIATEHFEMAMYQSLLTLAESCGDAETAALARRHLEEERHAAETLWPFIRSLGSLAQQIAPAPETILDEATANPPADGTEAVAPAQENG